METKFSVKLLSNLQVPVDRKTNKDVEKKIDRVKDLRVPRKMYNSKPNPDDMEIPSNIQLDRGDNVRQITNQKSIPKPNVEKKKAEDAKRSVDSSKKDLNKKEGIPTQIKTYLDVAGRKCLRERYTLRLKNSLNLSKNSAIKVETKESDNKNAKKADDVSTVKVKSDESSKDSVYTEFRPQKKPAKEAPCSQRKPIIKTVTVKNDSRVYKAVTFVDQKKHTPLQINIPNEYKKQKVKDKVLNLKVKLKLSKESVKEKPMKRKRGRKNRVLSPEFYIKGNASPPTEVAKWAPSCINHHTKPYYEAWVDTTLAAISKCSKKDKLYLEKQNIIKTFQKALLERPDTPDLVYENFNDERYTGRIKVSQR